MLLPCLPLLLFALYAQASPIKIWDIDRRQDAPTASDTAVVADVTDATAIGTTEALNGPTSALSPTGSPDTPPATSANDTSVPEATAPAAASATSNPGGAEAGAKPAASAESSVPGNTDLTVVKFAVLAESLEASFYDAALRKFSAQSFAEAGYADGQAIVDQLSVILKDEQAHLSALKDVAKSLGGSTADLDTCVFNFDAALPDVQTFLATARVLEFVGVDAYIGGATLISDKALLVSAAEIVTVEGRHNTILNLLNGGSSIPNAFDMVLTPQQVLSVAAPFVSGGCDPAAALGLQPTPALIVTNQGSVSPGTLVTFGGAGMDGKDTSTLFCNMIVGGAAQAIVLPLQQCVVPDGLDGPVHLFVTNSDKPLSTNIVDQDASIIVAGPSVVFIDTIPNALTALLKGQQSGKNSGASGQHLEAGKKVIVTKITVSKTRHGLGIHKPVDGGQGGAIALGWH